MKLALMDLDRLLGDFSDKAEELGIGYLYKRYWDNPSLFLQEIEKYDPNEIKERSEKLISGFKIYPETMPFLREMKNRDFYNVILTDNIVCGSKENKEILKKNFNEGNNCYIDEIHCTMRIGENGRIETDMSKESYALQQFNIYESGVLLLEGKNDIKVASRIREKIKERGVPIKIIKIGNNCKELDKFVDYSAKTLLDVFNFIDKE